MLAALLIAGTTLLVSQATAPGDYNDKWLCDLWAGAQCHRSSCQPEAKQICERESLRCRGRTRESIPQDRAQKAAACAKALLQAPCGGPAPAECEGVNPP